MRRLFLVALRAVRQSFPTVVRFERGHAERLRDAVADLIRVRSPPGALDDGSEQHVAVRRVGVGGAGLRKERRHLERIEGDDDVRPCVDRFLGRGRAITFPFE
jgi:hypothetical protein